MPGRALLVPLGRVLDPGRGAFPPGRAVLGRAGLLLEPAGRAVEPDCGRAELLVPVGRAEVVGRAVVGRADEPVVVDLVEVGEAPVRGLGGAPVGAAASLSFFSTASVLLSVVSVGEFNSSAIPTSRKFLLTTRRAHSARVDCSEQTTCTFATLQRAVKRKMQPCRQDIRLQVKTGGADARNGAGLIDLRVRWFMRDDPSARRRGARGEKIYVSESTACSLSPRGAQ